MNPIPDGPSAIATADPVGAEPSFSALSELARSADARRDWQASLKFWRRLSERFSDRAEGFAGMARAHRELREYDEAAALKPNFARFADNYGLATEFAWLARVMQDVPGAERCWRDIVARFPGNAGGHASLIRLLRETGKIDEAQKSVTAALEVFPSHTGLLCEQAGLAAARKETGRALELWRAIHDRNPDLPQPVNEIGAILLQTQKIDEAEEFLCAKIDQFPDNVDIGAWHAMVASRRREWSEAVARWCRLEYRHPTHVRVLSGLAEAYWGAKDEKSLEPVLHQLLTRYPDNGTGVIIQARLDMRRGRVSAAVERLTEVCKRHPRNQQFRSALNDARMLALVEGSENIDTGPIDHAVYGDEATLLSQFESLGDSCEFGLLQRKFGAEPISLLRWASISPQGLIKLLESRFMSLGDLETTRIGIAKDIYVLNVDEFDFGMATFIPVVMEPVETLHPKLCKRLKFLGRKLSEDLAAGEKIFVYKAAREMSEEEVGRLSLVVSMYGNSTLLVVQLASPGNPAGSLRSVNSHLLLGYLDRFSNTDISVELWLKICRASKAVGK